LAATGAARRKAVVIPLTPTLSLCPDRTQGEQVFGDIADRLGAVMRVPQIEGAQALGHEDHVPAAVGGGGAEGHGVAAQGLGQPKRVALEVDPAAKAACQASRSGRGGWASSSRCKVPWKRSSVPRVWG